MQDQGDSVMVGGIWPTNGNSTLRVHYFQALDNGQSANADGPEWYGNYASGLFLTFPD